MKLRRKLKIKLMKCFRVKTRQAVGAATVTPSKRIQICPTMICFKQVTTLVKKMKTLKARIWFISDVRFFATIYIFNYLKT